MNIQHALARIVGGQDLTRQEARAAMRCLIEGEATPAQLAGFAVALRMKGETPDEIAGLAEIMREAATRVDAGDVVDVVGTGDGSGSLNISTLSALIVTSAGGRVAKHGNRSATSACGSADFLEAVGMAIDLPPSGVTRCIDETGFGFMLAPVYHPAMRHAVAPRCEIGIRTVFNILGPLTNPAGARRQLTGVAASGMAETMARALVLLGCEHALVVHGHEGLDEISLAGPTQVHEVYKGEVRTYVLRAADFGLQSAPVTTVRGSTLSSIVGLARSVLAGRVGPARDVVLLNGGAALYVAGLAHSIESGIQRAAIELDSGRVREKLDQILVTSQRLRASQTTAVTA